VKSRALEEGNRGKPKEVVNLLEQPNYLVEEKYPTPPESPRIVFSNCFWVFPYIYIEYYL
jgi:hypothetical protein